MFDNEDVPPRGGYVSDRDDVQPRWRRKHRCRQVGLPHAERGGHANVTTALTWTVDEEYTFAQPLGELMVNLNVYTRRISIINDQGHKGKNAFTKA